jgi:hypothetical protein
LVIRNARGKNKIRVNALIIYPKSFGSVMVEEQMIVVDLQVGPLEATFLDPLSRGGKISISGYCTKHRPRRAERRRHHVIRCQRKSQSQSILINLT